MFNVLGDLLSGTYLAWRQTPELGLESPYSEIVQLL